MKRADRKKRDRREAAAKGNWIDKAITALSPTAGAKRMQARLAMGVMQTYAGARNTRPNDGWKSSAGSPVADTMYDLATLRERARDLVRNSPYAAKSVSVLVHSIVGEGIRCRISKNKDGAMPSFAEIWERWTQRCDYDGHTDFYGLQELAVRGMDESGESITLMHFTKPVDEYDIPLRLQVLESDYLDETKNVDRITAGVNIGGCIVQGVEFDAGSQRVAYWLFQRHPGDMKGSQQSRRISAAYVLPPLFLKKRPGQVRGITGLAPVIMKFKDLGDYEEADLISKKLSSCMTGWITTNGGVTEFTKQSETDQETATPVGKFEPGTFYKLLAGEGIEFGAPPISGDYSAYVMQHLRAIAAGREIPYELLTGDLSQLNFSSFRAGMMEFRRMINSVRWQLIIPSFCMPVWDKVLSLAVMMELADGSERAIWTPQRHESIDPLKDAAAALINVRAGFKSLKQVIAEDGNDPEEVLQEISNTNDDLDKLNLILDSDPRKQTKGGAAQINVNFGEGKNNEV